MKKTTLILLAAIAAPSWGAGLCMPHEVAIIDAEAHCVDGGISIGSTEEDGLKVACMENQKVKSLCGPDGQLTRLRAYSEWFGKLKQFEDQCANQGGTFAFQDASFAEPHNESFCLQAVPEVGANMFEEPLCNYRSLCPAVAVVCEKTCNELPIARLF